MPQNLSNLVPEMQQYIAQLNEAQQAPVFQKDGPMIIIAGAGSGKTRVLTVRISYLMSLGVDAFNILALTFTNKAAREMKKRIADIVGNNEAKNLWMGTFHSVFAKILRIEAEKPSTQCRASQFQKGLVGFVQRLHATGSDSFWVQTQSVPWCRN